MGNSPLIYIDVLGLNTATWGGGLLAGAVALGQGIAAVGAATVATAAAVVVGGVAVVVGGPIVIAESIDMIQEGNATLEQANRDAIEMQGNLDAFESRWREGDEEYYPPSSNKGKKKGQEYRSGKKKDRDKFPHDAPEGFDDWWHCAKDEYGGEDYDPSNPQHEPAIGDFLREMFPDIIP